MKLSEAIREGIKLRPRVGVLGERFSYVEGRGLCSDVWGAACEAVMPTVADFNWRLIDVFAFQRTTDAFNAVQLHYFRDYFNPDKMPARCPGAKQNAVHVGGRVVKRFGKPDEVKTYDSYAKFANLGGVTSECVKVRHLAGLVDHMYHKHRMSPEEIISFVEAYEQAQEAGAMRQIVVNQNFNHYQLTGGV
jgi:hypothetical protein